MPDTKKKIGDLTPAELLARSAAAKARIAEIEAQWDTQKDSSIQGYAQRVFIGDRRNISPQEAKRLEDLAKEWQRLQVDAAATSDRFAKFTTTEKQAAIGSAPTATAATPVHTAANPTQTTIAPPDAAAWASGTGANNGSNLISDADLQDLARTGTFDITPGYLAKLFPSDPMMENTGFVHYGNVPASPGSASGGEMHGLDRAAGAQSTPIVGTTGPFTSGMSSEMATGPTGAGFQNMSLRDVLAKPFQMKPDEVASTAVELFKAGYLSVKNFDPRKPLSQQVNITSAYTPEFQNAWQAWIKDSFLDRTKSMKDILTDKQASFGQELAAMAKAANAKTVHLTDSAQLTEHADVLGQQILGRKMTATEHASLIQHIHDLETQSQTAQGAGATDAQGNPVEDVNADARLHEAIRNMNPAEADAADVASQYDVFRSIIKGGGP